MEKEEIKKEEKHIKKNKDIEVNIIEEGEEYEYN